MPIYTVPCEINVDAATAPEAEAAVREMVTMEGLAFHSIGEACEKLAYKMYGDSEHPDPFDGHPDDPRGEA